jgi:hypothetical protein
MAFIIVISWLIDREREYSGDFTRRMIARPALLFRRPDRSGTGGQQHRIIVFAN